MDLLLDKLLPLFVYPTGMVFLLLVLVLVFWRRPHLQRLLIVFSLCVLFFGGNTWVANGLTRWLEWRYLPLREIPTAPVIVVLGGGTEPPIYPRPMVEVNGAGDRVIYAAELYHEHKAPNVLVSGGSLDWEQAPTSPAQDMAFLLQKLGVPADAIWLESTSRNTEENARNCRQILQPKGIHRILLVTSAIHMPRSVLIFQSQGFEVIPMPTDYTITTADSRPWSWQTGMAEVINLVPSAGNLSQTSRTMKEILGIAVFWLRERL
jgi:uncharacterized SAM-binding protein YcdF (DUF218 family)